MCYVFPYQSWKVFILQTFLIKFEFFNIPNKNKCNKVQLRKIIFTVWGQSRIIIDDLIHILSISPAQNIRTDLFQLAFIQFSTRNCINFFWFFKNGILGSIDENRSISCRKTKCWKRNLEGNKWCLSFFIKVVHYINDTIFRYKISIAIVIFITIDCPVHPF